MNPIALTDLGAALAAPYRCRDGSYRETCDVPTCTHPYCEMRRGWAWRDAYAAEHDDAYQEVVLHVSEPYDPAHPPPETNLRGFAAIMADGRTPQQLDGPDVERAAAAMLRQLNRGAWIRPNRCPGVKVEHALDAELWLWRAGHQLEARSVTTDLRVWLAMDEAHGIGRDGPRGMTSYELRLRRDLDAAPAGTQGTLL